MRGRSHRVRPAFEGEACRLDDNANGRHVLPCLKEERCQHSSGFCSATGAVPVTTCRILCFFGGRPGFQFYLKWFSLLLQISRLLVSCMAVFCDDVEADKES